MTKEGEVRKPQAWVLTNCRAMMVREPSLSKELSFSHTYTLGCYRVDALMSEALKRVLDRLPLNKRCARATLHAAQLLGWVPGLAETRSPAGDQEDAGGRRGALPLPRLPAVPPAHACFRPSAV